MIRFIVLCFCLATLLYGVVSEVVNISSCEGYADPCIDEIRVSPCKEAARNSPCRVKRGTDASIEVDFTPNFNSDTLLSQPYWDNGIADLPMVGMDAEGCKYTTCPLKAGTKQTYKYNLHISSSYPLATYNVKWKLTGDDKKGCCFLFKIKITR